MRTIRKDRRQGRESVGSPLSIYLHEINAVDLLTAEEERQLAAVIQRDDPKSPQYQRAFEHLIQANLRLVVNTARGYMGKGLALEDLIEEGNVGLIRAVKGFRPQEHDDGRFSTYASYWIKETIRRSLRIQTTSNRCPIRVPEYMLELLGKMRRTTAELTDSLGRPPSEEEVFIALAVPKKQQKIVRHTLFLLKLHPMPQGGDNEQGHWTLEESLPDDRDMSVAEKAVQSEDLDTVMVKLRGMDKREATILISRFGLDGKAPRTLKELGEELGLTRERVRQIQNQALRKLSEDVKE